MPVIARRHQFAEFYDGFDNNAVNISDLQISSKMKRDLEEQIQ